MLISFAAWSLTLRWSRSPPAVSRCTTAEAWQEAEPGRQQCLSQGSWCRSKEVINAVRVHWPTRKTGYSSLCTSLMRAVDKNTCNEEDALMPYCPTALSGLQSQSGIVTETRGRWELRFVWGIGHMAMEDGVDYPGQQDAGLWWNGGSQQKYRQYWGGKTWEWRSCYTCRDIKVGK